MALLHELKSSGHDGLNTRLAQALGPDLVGRDGGELGGQLPRATLVSAMNRWLPRLDEEVELFQRIFPDGTGAEAAEESADAGDLEADSDPIEALRVE